MIIWAIETSCDETGSAVVIDGRVRSNVVSSQVALHAEYGGVVPELATREHLRNLMPVAREALRQAGIGPGDVDAVAATQGPGLPQALMIGFKAAQALAFALDRPLMGIHHHEAHLYSAWIDGESGRARFDDFKPNVALVVSGGHTLLVHVPAVLGHRLLGSTLDDAAGECFDKVGKMLGLPYPGGPILDQLAEKGDPGAYDFPRPLRDDPGDDFSFSGLKTAVRYFLARHPDLAEDAAGLRDLCASVRAAVVEVLAVKSVRAAQRLGAGCLAAAGGVTSSRGLRRELAERCAQAGMELRLADPAYCTDNAGMIGVLAELKLQTGSRPAGEQEEVRPGWALPEVSEPEGARA